MIETGLTLVHIAVLEVNSSKIYSFSSIFLMNKNPVSLKFIYFNCYINFNLELFVLYVE